MTRTKLLAYHGDPAIKQKYVDRVKAHAAADEIVKGTYWEDGKGCAVGCTVHSNDHFAYETELGIPEGLARLQDFLFERLPNEKAKEFPLRFLEAIKPGADLYPLSSEFHYYLLKNELHFDRKLYPEVVRAVDRVIGLCSRQLQGETVTDEEWSAARYAAESAARSAAEFAAWSAARYAARYAAESAAESAAELAAESAAWSAAELAARYAAWYAAESAAWYAAESAAEFAAWSAGELAAWSAARYAAESAARSAAEFAAWSAAQYAAIERIAEKLLELLASAPVEDKVKGEIDHD